MNRIFKLPHTRETSDVKVKEINFVLNQSFITRDSKVFRISGKNVVKCKLLSNYL